MPPRGPIADLTLGALLRTWRDRLSPANAGLVTSANRQAPGLRREELAQLAGLSVDYVLRLEQGRATDPSAQVVTALARTLQRSREERDQLHRAVGLLPSQDDTVSTHVPPSIQRLIARLGDVPIAVFAADWTLLSCNDMWKALHGDPAALPPTELNLARAVFGTGPANAALRPSESLNGSETFETSLIADLKAAAGRYPADARLAALITELVNTSEAFKRLWPLVTSAAHTTDRWKIQHPAVGELSLDCDVLTAHGSDLRIVTYTVEAGTTDAGKLDLLRVTAAQALTTSSLL